MVLREVSIGKNKKDTSIEEERNEDTVGDLSQLLRVSIVTDPGDQRNSESLDDSVNYNNESCDDIGDTQDNVSKVEVLCANVYTFILSRSE